MILPEWTIAELQEKMETGELSSRQVVELYLQRIEAVDKNGPFINSIIELNPDALEIAANLDKERKAGKIRGRCTTLAHKNTSCTSTRHVFAHPSHANGFMLAH